jgi:hypothetical protein
VQLAAEERAAQLLGEDAPLFVEFSALLTWCTDAELAWHDDVNGGAHLENRHVSAVLYLTSGGGHDFQGGCLAVDGGGEAGEALLHVPIAGQLALYRSTERHRVTRVVHGTRCALTVWLTRFGGAAEDEKVLATLGGAASLPAPRPLPASLFCGDGGRGADARIAALAALRLRLHGCELDGVWLSGTDDAISDVSGKRRPQRRQRGAESTALYDSALRFADASAALSCALWVEAELGLALADCAPYNSAGLVAAADVIAEHALAVACGRAAIEALLPRWRRAGALFAD